jgi:integration host factor subunit alpha
MTKADLIESLYARTKIPKKVSAELVELLLESVKASIERGESVKISGFGHFHVRLKKSRVGRNPQTGKPIEIPARRVLSFRAGQHLKHALNAGHGRSSSRADADHRNGRALDARRDQP